MNSAVHYLYKQIKYRILEHRSTILYNHHYITRMRKIFPKAILLILSLHCNTVVLAQEVSPMLTAKFSQAEPFNNACPDKSAAGCGPVAIAQILTKYKQPAHGYDSVSYQSGSNKYAINVDMENMSFDWDNIKDSYKDEYNDQQADAVANLVYACGVAMYAQYGSSTSINNYAKMLYGLQHNLHISEDARYLRRQYYSTAEWIEILNTQLRTGHPVFYRGTWLFDGSEAGHMFVIDGLNKEGMYHVNFGHAGSGDKFTDINILNQSGTNPGGRGVCYNATQAMVINCYPTPENNDYPLQRCISEEAIILDKDTMLKQKTIDLGDKFTLSCNLRNYSLQYANVNYGWGLERDGLLIDILRQRTYGLNAGNKFVETRHLDFALPKNLEDGFYKLVLYSKSDIDTTWNKVWASAPTEVAVTVHDGKAEITVPDNHLGNPDLYLEKDIVEVENVFENTVSGRTFELSFINPTTNNFQDKIKLEIIADGEKYIYITTQPVFSQSKTTYQILVPQSAVALKGKNITSLKAYYYNVLDDSYIYLGTTAPSGINAAETETKIGDIFIYTVDGILIQHIEARNVTDYYSRILKTLPRGIYIIKEANKTRKIAL